MPQIRWPLGLGTRRPGQQKCPLKRFQSKKYDPFYHPYLQIKVIQGELKTVKEFRKRRAEMQQQIDQLQGTLEESEGDHEKAMAAMEYKFFEEKLRLQKEANRRIADLAGSAHEKAVT